MTSKFDKISRIEISDPERLVRDPLISVVMLTFNHERFIAQAIEGVLEQKTTFGVELIIGEDCSPDTTCQIALEYQKKYPELIRILTSEKNIGAHENFFSVYEATRGNYIALCEGDDYWCDPHKLQLQVDILEQDENCAGVFHDCYLLIDVTGDKKPRVGERLIDKNPDLESVIMQNNIPTAAMLYRKMELDERRLDLLSATPKGDYMIALLVAENGYWHYVPQIMSVYRIHDGGIWSGERSIAVNQHNVNFYDLFVNDARYATCQKAVNQKQKNARRQLGIAYAAEGRFLKSLGEYLSSLGPRGALRGNYTTSYKFWRSTVRHLLIKIGMKKPVRCLLGLVRQK